MKRGNAENKKLEIHTGKLNRNAPKMTTLLTFKIDQTKREEQEIKTIKKKKKLVRPPSKREKSSFLSFVYFHYKHKFLNGVKKKRNSTRMERYWKRMRYKCEPVIRLREFTLLIIFEFWRERQTDMLQQRHGK